MSPVSFLDVFILSAVVLEVLHADVRPTRMRCVTLPLTVLGMALAR